MNTSKLSITSSSELPVEKRLVNLLGISENAEDDLDFLTDREMQGSCQWLLQRQAFQDWAADSPNTSGILWLTGIPGSGKSILASFIIALLKKGPLLGPVTIISSSWVIRQSDRFRIFFEVLLYRQHCLTRPSAHGF